MSIADTEAAITMGIAPEGRISDGTIAFVLDTAARLGFGVGCCTSYPRCSGAPPVAGRRASPSTSSWRRVRRGSTTH